MTPIQTLIFDKLRDEWLTGDTVNNLHTCPETGATEPLSAYLSQPSRYSVTRWTGEKDSANEKIYVGDILVLSDETRYTVQESRSQLFVEYGGECYILSVFCDSNEFKAVRNPQGVPA